MSFVLWHSADAQPMQASIGLASTRLVFRASEVPVVRDALELLDQIGALAGTHTRRVEDATATARRDGFERGREEGLRQGRDDAHAQWLVLARDVATERARLRAQVAELALAATRKIVGDLEPGERLAAAAGEAARQAVPDEPLELHVHPSRVADVERALARGVAGFAWPASAAVRGDDAMTPDGCRVRTAHGATEVGIDTQLSRLAVAWGLGDLPPDARSGSQT